MNELMLAERQQIFDQLLAKGMDPSAAGEKAAEAVDEAQDLTVESYVEVILDDGVDFVEQDRAFIDGFSQRLRKDYGWGDGLDIFANMVGVVDAASTAFIARTRERLAARSDPDVLLEVLVQLNGQGIRVAREVHTLLSSGYPLGALALSRTLYEVAVRASVLSDFGRTEGHEDLATRFVEHDKVVNLDDALVFQRDAEVLGYQPFSKEYLAQLQTDHDDLIARYGKTYRGPYGWAVGLPGVTRGRFDELERLAETAHRRGFYKWSSHLVHADAKALRLNRVVRGGAAAVLTAATNNGLADPAEHALYALNLTFVQLVTAVEDPGPGDMYVCKALYRLLDRAREALVAAERGVDQAEERLQAELAREGKAMTPMGVVDLEPLPGTHPGDDVR